MQSWSLIFSARSNQLRCIRCCGFCLSAGSWNLVSMCWQFWSHQHQKKTTWATSYRYTSHIITPFNQKSRIPKTILLLDIFLVGFWMQETYMEYLKTSSKHWVRCICFSNLVPAYPLFECQVQVFTCYPSNPGPLSGSFFGLCQSSKGKHKWTWKIQWQSYTSWYWIVLNTLFTA